MENIKKPINNIQNKEIRSKEACVALSSKSFAIYCFNGKTINIDSNAKLCKDLPNIIDIEDKRDLNNTSLHMNITDINFETKHKSVNEIKQSILKILGREIEEQDKNSVLETNSFNCNKFNNDKCAEEANQTFDLFQRKEINSARIK